ncbi:MAG: phosphatase PAP2 family protein [Tannerella sp.]|jgi:undecaprenyl-diphosphatase|nr:phosphatase PAP2 family protein [Tannerella sp.]
MLEKVLEYERSVFLWLNGGHNAFWDHFMWLYTGQLIWLPVVLFFVFTLFYKKDWKEALLIILSIALVFTLCDQCSNICKDYFERLRPTHHPAFMEFVKTVNDYRGGNYGFISGHAANSFGFATFSLLLFRNRWYTISILIWSMMMVYTRIYLGVHFISDIVSGAIAGLIIGYLVFRLYALIRSKLLHKLDKPHQPFKIAQINLLLVILYTTIIGILIYSFIESII